jgi:trk system potassium uptake protein TrkA
MGVVSMDIVIVGAGQVGRHIAGSVDASHEVGIIDQDPERIDRVKYELDVLTIHGDGSDVEILEQAGVEDADLVIASTNNDQTNIVVCGMSKILTDVITVARVNNTNYLKSWRRGKQALGVDYMVGTNYLVARTITQIIGLPSATDVDSFVDGNVHMAEFSLPENSPAENKTIQEINDDGEFDAINIMAIFSAEEGDEFKFPRGDTVVQPGDQLLVAGKMAGIYQFARFINSAELQTNGEIVIFGGGEVGYQTADFLRDSDYQVRLIEQDEERARFLAEKLPETLVLNENAENPEFLLEEHVDEADVAITALGSDQGNLLVSLLSKQLGAQRAVSVVGNKDYVNLFEQVGVDVAVNPRLLTAEEIIRHTRTGLAENVALLESEEAEVLEIEIDRDSILADRLIKDAASDLPRECVLGAIMRNTEFIAPRGHVTIKPGDHVLILVDSGQVDQVQELI